MPTQMEKLRAAQEREAQKKHEAEQQEKRLKKQICDLKNKERHRLCTRGAYLEKLLQEPEQFSDEEVFKILDYVFGTPYAKSHLKAMLEAKHNCSDDEKAEATEEENVAGADVRITGNS